ncbi:uncharacterized protein [Amphiura filiformis]|uniref:uncharacterized protein n=1 Tax=Amphiura filiformis TaxID=82378 RepID=UPI003B21E526
MLALNNPTTTPEVTKFTATDTMSQDTTAEEGLPNQQQQNKYSVAIGVAAFEAVIIIVIILLVICFLIFYHRRNATVISALHTLDRDDVVQYENQMKNTHVRQFSNHGYEITTTNSTKSNTNRLNTNDESRTNDPSLLSKNGGPNVVDYFEIEHNEQIDSRTIKTKKDPQLDVYANISLSPDDEWKDYNKGKEEEEEGWEDNKLYSDSDDESNVIVGHLVNGTNEEGWEDNSIYAESEF